VENNLEECAITEIWETEEEKKLSVIALKKKYIIFARSRFISNPPKAVLNKNTGWYIEITNRVINEWWGKSRTRERVLAVQLLDAMIERAKFIETVADNKNTPGIESVSYFENCCKINNKLYMIKIAVKKMIGKNRRFAYYYAAIKEPSPEK
jgi:hypothetical protein